MSLRQRPPPRSSGVQFQRAGPALPRPSSPLPATSTKNSPFYFRRQERSAPLSAPPNLTLLLPSAAFPQGPLSFPTCFPGGPPPCFPLPPMPSTPPLSLLDNLELLPQIPPDKLTPPYPSWWGITVSPTRWSFSPFFIGKKHYPISSAAR